jgi:hypothetical protein
MTKQQIFVVPDYETVFFCLLTSLLKKTEKTGLQMGTKLLLAFLLATNQNVEFIHCLVKVKVKVKLALCLTKYHKHHAM